MVIKETMKHNLSIYLIMMALLSVATGFSQENQTIFKSSAVTSSSGYGAVSNKFSRVNGDYANIVEMYGGWFINRNFLIGLEGAATTNRLTVPEENKLWQGNRMTYQYGQFGMMMEFVTASTQKIHLNFNLMTGAGFILQYDRDEYHDLHIDHDKNPNFFFLLEPGVQIELNLMKWMRFSPGISYRRAFGSASKGLTDDELSSVSGNLTMKFGRF
jgi:hypothetical protein